MLRAVLLRLLHRQDPPLVRPHGCSGSLREEDQATKPSRTRDLGVISDLDGEAVREGRADRRHGVEPASDGTGGTGSDADEVPLPGDLRQMSAGNGHGNPYRASGEALLQA